MTQVVRAYIEAQGVRYVFDACMQEDYSDESDVTEHPVEDGFDATDHVRHKSQDIMLDVVMSNTPLDDTNTGLIVVGPGDVVPTLFSGRAEAFLDAIKSLKARSVPVRVFTSLLQNADRILSVSRGGFLFTFSQFLIRSISVQRNNKTGNIVRMGLALKQLRIVTNKIVNAPTSLVSTGADLGNKPAVEATEPDKEQAKSWLLRLNDTTFEPVTE